MSSFPAKSAPKQRRLTAFFVRKDKDTLQKETNEAPSLAETSCAGTSGSDVEKMDESTASVEKLPKKTATKREFRTDWLKQNAWLQYENDKMTCTICMSEGKDNPFTPGCQNFYPCHTVSSTWKLLSTNHPDSFPNLMRLSRVAVIAPLQTATVERGFSVQNDIKVSSRNKLSGERLEILMQISLGPAIEVFDFESALKKWKQNKSRKLYSN